MNEDYLNNPLEIKGNHMLAFRCNDTAVVTPDWLHFANHSSS